MLGAGPERADKCPNKEAKMKPWNLRHVVLVLTAISFFALAGCAQRSVQAQGAATVAPEGPTFTVKGKIDYWNNKDYVVIGEEPPRTYFMVNQTA